MPGPRSMTSEPSRHVLAIRDECYAELVRQWMRRAKDAAARHVHGVSGHVIDAVLEDIGLQRYFLPEEFTEDVVRRTLQDLISDDEPDGAPNPARRQNAMIRRQTETT